MKHSSFVYIMLIACAAVALPAISAGAGSPVLATAGVVAKASTAGAIAASADAVRPLPKGAVARAFGVAFRVDDATVEQYKGYGLDLESTQGNAQHVLPVPAVFVIDREGRIGFSHYNPDYKVRLSAEELLAAAP